MKGETAEEIAGCAADHARSAAPLDAGPRRGVVDTCGTGGDGAGTFNISTAAASGGRGCRRAGRQARQPRASRAAAAAPTCSRRSASRSTLPPEAVASAASTRPGIGFMFAPTLPPGHAPRRGAAPRARRPHRLQPARPADQPGRRPAPGRRRLRPALTRAGRRRAAARSAAERALRRPRRDGLDEISIDRRHQVVARCADGDGRRRSTSRPSDVGLQPARAGRARAAATRRRTRRIVRASWRRAGAAAATSSLLNAGAGAGRRRPRRRPRDGVALAREAIDSGAAGDTLEAGRVLERRRRSSAHDRSSTDRRRRREAAPASRPRGSPLEPARAAAAAAAPPAGARLRGALRAERAVAIIAEIKRALAVQGVLRADVDPPRWPRRYAAAGAAAISVLTDERLLRRLARPTCAAVRAAVALPLLRKDFIVDSVPGLEARAVGADAVLLIVAALDARRARRPARPRRAALGLDALVEVHDRGRARARARRRRDARSASTTATCAPSTVDLELTARLAAHVPADVVAGEPRAASATRADVARLARARRATRSWSASAADARGPPAAARRCRRRCGARRRDDPRQDLRHHAGRGRDAAVEAGADPRLHLLAARARGAVDAEQAARIVAGACRRSSLPVGVFVDEPLDEVARDRRARAGSTSSSSRRRAAATLRRALGAASVKAVTRRRALAATAAAGAPGDALPARHARPAAHGGTGADVRLALRAAAAIARRAAAWCWPAASTPENVGRGDRAPRGRRRRRRQRRRARRRQGSRACSRAFVAATGAGVTMTDGIATQQVWPTRPDAPATSAATAGATCPRR